MSQLLRTSSRTAGRLAALLAVAVAAAAGSPVPAMAQGGSNAKLFSVSPARRIAVGRPPAQLQPATVTNTTDGPFAVTVIPVLLDQDSTGQFTFSEAPSDERAMLNVVSAAPAKFALAPGTSRRVRLEWHGLPPGRRSIAVGIIFQGRPAPKAGQPLGTVDRLLSVNFLRLPGHYRLTGRFTALPAEQFQPKVIRFLPTLENTGEIAGAPRHARISVRDAAGRTVYKAPFSGDLILPNRRRQFPIDLHKILPAGSYKVTAAADFGTSRHILITRQFRLSGPNTLPTPALRLTGLEGHGTIGDRAHATGVFTSGGSAPAATEATVELFSLARSASPTAPVATTKVRVGPLAPGKRQPLDATLGPKLAAGVYRVTVLFRDPQGTLQRASADFVAKRSQSFADRFKRWISDHWILLVGLLVLLLILFLLWRQLRERRRLERELAARAAAEPGVAAAPAGAPPVPEAPATPAPAATAAPAGPVPARVNINTASVEELQRLPGVGPAAAGRIVAHREEYGPFRSLDDLAAVEQFDAGRIEGLRDVGEV